MEWYEKEALLKLIYAEEYRESTKETNGGLYDKSVNSLKEEFKEFKGEKTDFIYKWADKHTSIYTTDIFAWYAGNANLSVWADDALNQFGYDKKKGIIGILRVGICRFLESFAYEVLEDEAESMEEI